MYKRFISITNKAVTLILGVVLTSVLAVSAFGAPDEQKSGLDRQVRHELLMLPYYGIFDNLEYSINGGTVTLRGAVLTFRRFSQKTEHFRSFPLISVTFGSAIWLVNRKFLLGAQPSIHSIH